MTSVNAKQEALLDELLKDYTDPQDILGEHGLLKRLTKRVVERVLEAELTAHLGYAPHGRHGTEEQNARNGKGQKTVQTDTGPVDPVVPRDRNRFVKLLRLRRSSCKRVPHPGPFHPLGSPLCTRNFHIPPDFVVEGAPQRVRAAHALISR